MHDIHDKGKTSFKTDAFVLSGKKIQEGMETTDWFQNKVSVQGEQKESAVVIRAPLCEIFNSFWKLTGWYEYPGM